MKLVIETSDFTLVVLKERQGYMLWPGYYMKLENGYWYCLELKSGIMRRMRHMGPVRLLNEMLEAISGRDNKRSN